MNWLSTCSPLLAVSASNAALVTFLLYTLAVFALAWLSNRLLQKKSFLSEYFLGSRSLGVWAFALTFAATSASGGSFMGFPAKIYSHGWILALWIGSYMVVPICTMGFLGKRINQVARISGAITVPDVIRDRFRSPLLGLLSVSLIVFFMSFNLVAQFKGGSFILKTLLADVPAFTNTATAIFGGTTADPQYLLCLLSFGVAVVIYTTFGGFRAVVWTDVMQGIVMVAGVMILLPLAINQVGGMPKATRALAEQTPPQFGQATLSFPQLAEDQVIPKGEWLSDRKIFLENWRVTMADPPRLFRVAAAITLKRGDTTAKAVQLLEIEHKPDRLRILKSPEELIFVGGETSGIVKTPAANGDGNVFFGLRVADFQPGRMVGDVFKAEDYAFGGDQPGVYVTGPGPSPSSGSGFLPLSLAISFFFMWSISGSGQPSNMVRLMAFNNTRTLRRSIFTVAIYYTAIYFPLVMIFCCARVLLPGMEAEPDRILPAMAVFLTENAGVGWLAGLLLAAPFAAVMSTVDSFLLMISSALVRDIYQRNLNPDAEERTIKRLSYFFTLLIGAAAVLGAINPPQFLQDIIVYTGSGLAASFLAPVVYALYWPRVNRSGVLAAMLAGFTAHFTMYLLGIPFNGSFFKPYLLFSFDPVLVGLGVSFVSGVIVTVLTPPPPADLVERYFLKRTTK